MNGNKEEKVVKSPVSFFNHEISKDGTIREKTCSSEVANKIVFASDIKTEEEMKAALERADFSKPPIKQAVSFFRNVHKEDGIYVQEPCTEKEARKNIKTKKFATVTVAPKGEGHQSNRRSSVNNNIVRNADITQQASRSPLCNFSIIPIERLIEVDKDGNELFEDEIIHIEVVVYAHVGEEMREIRRRIRITAEEIDNLIRIIKRKIPEAVTPEKKYLVDIINEFRMRLGGTSIIKMRKFQGWNQVDGSWRYFTRTRLIGNIRSEIEADLPEDTTSNMQITLNNILLLLDNRIISMVLLLFSMLGVSYELFRQAGYPIRFLLFMVGKTGSFKTAIAKVLFHQLMRDEERDYPRRIDMDTTTSLEMALIEKGMDTVTLIDDVHPSPSKAEQKHMEEKIGVIQRMIGDGTSKSRSDGQLRDKKGKGISGVVALTGEYRGNGSHSSFLRTLFLAINKDEVNVDALTYLQSGNHVTTLVWGFIKYLESQWVPIRDYIQLTFPQMRREIRLNKRIKSARMADTYITLFLLLNIYSRYANEWLYMEAFGKPEYIDDYAKGIFELLVENDNYSDDYNPAKIFMRSVFEMIETKFLVLNSERLTNENVARFDGFFDSRYYYIKANLLFAKAETWISQGKFVVPYNRDEMLKILADESYIVRTKNGRKANGEQKYQNLFRLPIGNINDKGNAEKVAFVKIPRDGVNRIYDDLMEGTQ